MIDQPVPTLRGDGQAMPRMILTDVDTMRPRAVDFHRDAVFSASEGASGMTSLTLLHRDTAVTYRVVETFTQIQLLRNVAMR